MCGVPARKHFHSDEADGGYVNIIEQQAYVVEVGGQVAKSLVMELRNAIPSDDVAQAAP